MPKRKNNVKLAMTREQAARFNDVEKEIMRRLLEREPPESIYTNLGLTRDRYNAIVQTPLFVGEYAYQGKHADRNVAKRLESLASEALDVVREVMRNAATPSYRLKAALEILDRSGNVKVEKRLQINADAEAVIKALNQQGVAPVELEATVVSDEIEDAVIEVINDQKAQEAKKE